MTKYGMLFGCALIVGPLLGLHTTYLNAQEYPTKPVRVVVTNAAGALIDSLARIVFAKVAETTGQQFVVDNRPSAGGIIAAETVAKAAADGYTLLVTSNSILTVNPFLFSKLSYDPVRDFDPVTMLSKVSEVLIVNPSLGVKTLEDFIRLAKASSGKPSTSPPPRLR